MTDTEIIEIGESIKWVYLPMQDQIIAFARLIEKQVREEDAAIAEEFNTFPCALSTVGKTIAAAILESGK